MTPRKPRLVFLVTEYYFFHAMRNDLASPATRAAYDVKVITYGGNSTHLPPTEGVEVIALPWRRANSLVKAALQFPRELAQVRHMLWLLDPDILHNIAMKPAVIGSFTAPRRTRVINTITGFGFLFFAKGALAAAAQRICGRVLRRGAERGAEMVVHNSVDVNFARDKLRIPANRVRLIRGLGLDTDHFAPLPAPASDRPFRFLMIARLLYMKGVQVAVDAQQALRRQGRDVELLVCGTGDPDNPSSIPPETIAAWSRLPGVRFLGQVRDVRGPLAESHVVVHPALGGEGLPRVLLEGAACGRPLIASNVSGNSDIVVDHDNGLLVPPGDSGALAAAMAWMLEHPAERAHFGERGRARVLQEFASRHVASGYDELYREAHPA